MLILVSWQPNKKRKERLKVYTNFAEKDATDEFEFVGHSDSAKEMMKKYYIGDFDKPAIPMKNKHNPAPQQNHSLGSAIKILLVLVPLLILGLAFALQYFGKKG